MEERVERAFRKREASQLPEESGSKWWILVTSMAAWAYLISIASVIWSLLPSTHFEVITFWNPWTWRFLFWGLTALACSLIVFRDEIDDSPLRGLWDTFIFESGPHGNASSQVVGILEGSPGIIAFTGWLLLLGSPLVIYWLIEIGEKLQKV